MDEIAGDIAQLAPRSKERIAKDADMQKVLKDLEESKKNKGVVRLGDLRKKVKEEKEDETKATKDPKAKDAKDPKAKNGQRAKEDESDDGFDSHFSSPPRGMIRMTSRPSGTKYFCATRFTSSSDTFRNVSYSPSTDAMSF